MKKQAIEQTQLNKVIDNIAAHAISNTVKDRIINIEPSTELEDVLRLQEETGEALNLILAGKSIPSLSNEEIDAIFNKIELGYVLEPKELIEVADFLNNITAIKNFFELHQDRTPILYTYASQIELFTEIEDRIRHSIKHNKVSDDASRSLKKARQAVSKYESEIRDKLNKYIAHPSNKSKIQEFMIIERDGVSTIPIKNAFKSHVKGRVVGESGKGSTVFMQLESTMESNQKLNIAQAEEITIVYQVLAELTDAVALKLEQMKNNIDLVFQIELIVAKAKYSAEIQGQKVHINNAGIIDLKDAVHPLLGEHAVPLTITLGKVERGLVITGSNSGGKTVVLKTVGLLTLMTMIGVYIPANPDSDISIFNHVLVDIGDYQDFNNALSTFSGHMNNMKSILELADEHSLVLVDEIGSGTEPSEGAAIAIAMLEHIVNNKSVVLASTHYGEIKEFALNSNQFITAAMAFNVETLMPLYQLLMNEVGSSNGFWLAKLMNISDEVLNRATVHLNNFRKIEQY